MLPNTFCPLPWVNLSTDVNGSLRPCCKFAQPEPANEYQLPNMKEGRLDVLWNDIRFQQLRKAFLDGKKPNECQSCWDEEAAGIPSFRLQFCKDKKINTSDIEFNTVAKTGPQAIDLKLNNVCNLKCRICGPQASSTFLKEYQEIHNIKVEDGAYWLSNKILGTFNEDVIRQWAQDLVHLEITGGEPMASPENIKVLELLINQGRAEYITILLNTNGTLYNKKFLDLIVQFKEVIFNISIDDVEDRLEYERYPTEWNTVQINIAKFVEIRKNNPHFYINLCPTVSIFNVYYMPEYLKWAKENGLPWYFNMLHYTQNHSIKNLPDKLKNIVAEKLTGPEFDPIKNFLFLPCERESLIEEFIKLNEERDRVRGQDFHKTFGAWAAMINEYRLK
jgi:radical SAM protein with 4Fe4S-binding SPASM domain